MSIELTELQQQALDKDLERPPRFIDPRTNAAYVLVNAEEYEHLREILDEERWRADVNKVATKNAIGRMNEDG